ncbi:hypothetical protein O3P69_018587 [Scylla paramamosain]|uniref:Ionotropic glutamate receptor C-terminal domain-containing protein n=1 Tax=Scylla paramamosain TaxID=85552 RepID=A0AAW0T2N8_SCYPA
MWFQGSRKYILTYPGSYVTSADLAHHPSLRDGHNLVVALRGGGREGGGGGGRGGGGEIKKNTTKDEKNNTDEENEGMKEEAKDTRQSLRFLRVCPFCPSDGSWVKEAAPVLPGPGFDDSLSLFPDLYTDFQGYQLRVVTLVYEPFSCYTKDAATGLLTPTGGCVDNLMVWGAFVVILAAGGPLYHLTCRASTYGGREWGRGTPSLAKACLITFGAAFSQGVRWVQRDGPRTFTALYVVAMYVAVTMYVAMLTASLTLPTLSPTLDTLQQLVHSDFSWGIQRVYKGLQQCPTLDACIARARDTKFAFITWRTYLEDRIAVRFTSRSGQKQLHVASGDIFPVELGWAMNPGSPYRHHFNAKIRAMIENGLISKWLRDVINDPNRRESDDTTTPATGHDAHQALGLDHLQVRVTGVLRGVTGMFGVFYLLTIGYTASFLAFASETLCTCRNTHLHPVTTLLTP